MPRELEGKIVELVRIKEYEHRGPNYFVDYGGTSFIIDSLLFFDRTMTLSEICDEYDRLPESDPKPIDEVVDVNIFPYGKRVQLDGQSSVHSVEIKGTFKLDKHVESTFDFDKHLKKLNTDQLLDLMSIALPPQKTAIRQRLQETTQ